MDVSLVLTHRCNLDCGYCYAGEHHRAAMAAEMVDRSVDLMFADDGDTVQLSFFGGEPFLAFETMKQAVERARSRADASGKRLLIQCTTNGSVVRDEHVAFVAASGMRCTVSIDGVREAHDLNRPCGGGASSFDQVLGGLHRLVHGGCDPDAMMVITPETTPYVFRSVCFLWDQGVRKVRANMLLDAPWTTADRDELREQLLAVCGELVARRARGQRAVFVPLEAGMRNERERARRRSLLGIAPVTAAACGGIPEKRWQIVVGTTGNLYPCAPMVGEDRDDGPEAALRLGHLDDGASAIGKTVNRRGAGCGDGKGCACAAYLETGNRDTPGANGAWYARVCEHLGAAIVIALADLPGQRDRIGRRPFLFGLAAAGGVALATPALLHAGLFGGDAESSSHSGCKIQGGIKAVSQPLPVVEPPPPVHIEGVDGEMLVAPEPDPPRPPEPLVKGEMKAPPPPPPEPDPPVPGQLMAPPPPPPEPEPEPENNEVVRGNIE